MPLLPEEKILDTQLKNQTSNYKCFSCHKIFSGKQMLFENMSSNFNVAGLDNKQKIPKCPYCNSVAFFGFKEV